MTLSCGFIGVENHDVQDNVSLYYADGLHGSAGSRRTSAVALTEAGSRSIGLMTKITSSKH